MVLQFNLRRLRSVNSVMKVQPKMARTMDKGLRTHVSGLRTKDFNIYGQCGTRTEDERTLQ